MNNKCPKQLRWAIMHFARSVKMVEELGEHSSCEPLCEYHYREYVDLMESILVDQVVTAFPDTDEMTAVLTSAGLEHLVEDAIILARELSEDNG